MREGQKRINVYIPEDLYSRVLNSEYNLTEAIIKGLTNLLEIPGEDFESKADTNVSLENPNVIHEINATINSQEIEEYKRDIAGYKENIKALNIEIVRLKEALSDSPDPVELAEMKGSFKGMEKVIDEKDKRIEALEREVSRLDMFAHYFKNVEVKQIEAPGEKKKWWKFW
jgi:predicted RNase H-like nuclease (RuvC/YqgF family)